MTKKFAAFDIDGTIFRWQLYHELFDELVREGIIGENQAQPVFEARRHWKSRIITFVDYENLLVEAMEKSIVGLEEETIIKAADRIMAENSHYVYRYTMNLLKELRGQGYTIIAISGSHQQLVERFAKIHNIDITFGRQYGVVDGKITEDVIVIYGRKAEILNELVKKHELSWEDSYAIGDSGSDIDMLKLVTNPIAFNPDEKLFQRAKEEGWKIVVERKSIFYELESNGQSFVLA